jgi:hypothetical protein
MDTKVSLLRRESVEEIRGPSGTEVKTARIPLFRAPPPSSLDFFFQNGVYHCRHRVQQMINMLALATKILTSMSGA